MKTMETMETTDTLWDQWTRGGTSCGCPVQAVALSAVVPMGGVASCLETCNMEITGQRSHGALGRQDSADNVTLPLAKVKQRINIEGLFCVRRSGLGNGGKVAFAKDLRVHVVLLRRRMIP